MEEKPKRRWFRFSAFDLFSSLTLLCIGAAPLSLLRDINEPMHAVPLVTTACAITGAAIGRLMAKPYVGTLVLGACGLFGSFWWALTRYANV